MINTKVKIKNEYLWTAILILTNIFVFFGYAIPNRTPFLLVTALASLILYIVIYKKIYKKVIKNNFVWIIVLIFFLIQLIYTVSFELTIKFIMTFGAAIIMKVIYESLEYNLPNYEWKDKLLKITLICSGIHVAATLIYTFFPDTIIKFNKYFLTSEQFYHNYLQHRQGLNPGICDDYGFNAFCNLIFIGLILCRYLVYKKINFFTIVSLISGILAITVIGKRNHLLCLALASIICFLLSFKSTPLYKKVLTIISICLISFIIYNICAQVPATSILIKRLEQSQTTAGLLNGRETLYAFVIDKIRNYPFFGIGIRGICYYIGDGHNIYMQIIAETGVFCSILIFISFIQSLIQTIRKYLRSTSYNFKYCLLFSIFVQLFFLINGISENPFYVESILIYYLIISSYRIEGV